MRLIRWTEANVSERNLWGGRPPASILVMVLMLCVFLPASARAADPVAPEYKIKAGFLYNFTKLCDWPRATFSAPDSPLVIGVLGEDPFGSVLEETVRGHTVSGRTVAIRRCQHVSEIKGCQVLFISRSEEAQLEMVLASLADEPILTIGESDRFLRCGGVIRLVKLTGSEADRGSRSGADGDMVGFEINLPAAQRAHLQLSAKLLRLARPPAPGTKE